MTTILFGVLFFFFGAIIGSFLNVVVYRFNTNKSITTGRSMCMSCSKTLEWHELIPLASFIALRGKCSKCKRAIAWQYPIVEAVTGVMFVFLGLKFLPVFMMGTPFFFGSIVWYTYFWCLALVIAVYDIRHTIIPDRLVWLANILALASLYLFSGFQFAPHAAAWNALLAGPVLAAPFFVLWFVSRGRWMGLGDAKLMLGLGWLLGAASGLVSLFLAFWIGAIFSVILLAIRGRRYTMHSQIPFGPFLVLGAFIVFISSASLATFASLFIL